MDTYHRNLSLLLKRHCSTTSKAPHQQDNSATDGQLTLYALDIT
jgi:hypothetical protein